MTTILLIRHGSTAWSREGRIAGRRDIGLDPAGRAELERTAEALGDLPVVELLSSPQARAVESAEILARTVGLEVARDPRLQEVAPGAWDGLTWTELRDRADYLRFLADPEVHPIPGGEPLAEVQARAARAVLQALEDNPAGSLIVVVSHASVIRLLVAHYQRTPLGAAHRFPVPPGAITALRFAGFERPPVLLGSALTTAASVRTALQA